MALSEENRILLQLILGRGKSYSDLSGLLGIDQGEVRSRARAALGELDPSQPAPDGDLTDYLLGQTDAIASADVKHRINTDPATAETAGALSDQLRLLVPGSSTPIAPGTAATSGAGGRSRPASRQPTGLFGSKRRDANAGAAGDATAGSTGGFAGAQRRMIAILFGVGLLAVILVLVLTGVIGGSGNNDEKSGEPPATTATLTPVKGETGKGIAQFGFSGADLAANLQISDLKPSGGKDSYTLWLYGSAGVFPIHQATVDETGAISGQITLNEAVICLVATDVFPQMRLSRVSNAEMAKVLRQARQANDGNGEIPDYVGETVLTGRISMPQSSKDQIVPNCTTDTPPENQ